MRLWIAIGVLLVGGVAFVMHERKSALENHLGVIATELGHRHVHVHCQSFAGNLLDVSNEAGYVKFDASGVPLDYMVLKRPICQALARYPKDVRSPAYACVLQNAQCSQRILYDMWAVHTLAHEDWHLHGIGNEALTECNAMQTTAQAAELFGADAQSAQATATYLWTHMYGDEPDEYRTPECANGGPDDLRPADPVWP
jgi:hypothetical protein